MASFKQKRSPVHVTKRSAIPSAATTDLDDEVPSDYLQDPELWRDPLPQPFRMIDEVLQNFLDDVWDEILRAERKRSEDALKPRIAVENAFKEVTTPTLHGLLYVTFRNNPVLLVASGSGLHTIKTDHGGAYTELVPSLASPAPFPIRLLPEAGKGSGAKRRFFCCRCPPEVGTLVKN